MRKGEKMSPEQKARQSASMRGKPSAMKGKHHTTEAKAKIGLKSRGRKHNLGKKRPDVSKRNTELKKGTKHTKVTKERISSSLTGKFSKEKNPMWKGGVTPINNAIRTSKEYKLWRKAVFERDNYTCVFCKARSVEIHADHIKPFALYPELRFAIDNGRTLCVPCHKTTETYARNNKRS